MGTPHVEISFIIEEKEGDEYGKEIKKPFWPTFPLLFLFSLFSALDKHHPPS